MDSVEKASKTFTKMMCVGMALVCIIGGALAYHNDHIGGAIIGVLALSGIIFGVWSEV